MNSTCPIHGIPLLCPACIGQKGGKSTSEAKVEAARVNVSKGWSKAGRPKGSKNKAKGGPR